jgi:hypothetical protein
VAVTERFSPVKAGRGLKEHFELQGSIRTGRGPLQHGQIAIGVASGEDRTLPDVGVDRDWLLRTVVEDLKIGAVDQLWTVIAQAELGCPDAADHPVGREAVRLGCPRSHEVPPPPENIQREKP